MKWWALKRGVELFRAFIKRPYITIRPETDKDVWHEHICVALRLGPGVYTAFCPYAGDRAFEAEAEDRCELCEYFSIIYAPDGKLRLDNAKLFQTPDKEG